MGPKYFKLSLREKDIYFMIYDIKKHLVYSASGQNFYDYQIVIKDIHLPPNSTIDSEYGGQFVCIDEHKNLRILSYIYQKQDYWTSLDNVMKEILLGIFKRE
jgi:hypothetical protein